MGRVMNQSAVRDQIEDGYAFFGLHSTESFVCSPTGPSFGRWTDQGAPTHRLPVSPQSYYSLLYVAYDAGSPKPATDATDTSWGEMKQDHR